MGCLLDVLGSSLEAQEEAADIVAQIPPFWNAVPVSQDSPELQALYSNPPLLYMTLSAASDMDIGEAEIAHIHEVADLLLDIVQNACGVRRCDAGFNQDWRKILKIQDDILFRSYFSHSSWMRIVAPILLAAGASLREEYAHTVQMRQSGTPHFHEGEFSDDTGSDDPDTIQRQGIP